MNEQQSQAANPTIAKRRGRPSSAQTAGTTAKSTGSTGSTNAGHRKRQGIVSTIASLERSVAQLRNRMDQRLDRLERRVS